VLLQYVLNTKNAETFWSQFPFDADVFIDCGKHGRPDPESPEIKSLSQICDLFTYQRRKLFGQHICVAKAKSTNLLPEIYRICSEKFAEVLFTVHIPLIDVDIKEYVSNFYELDSASKPARFPQKEFQNIFYFNTYTDNNIKVINELSIAIFYLFNYEYEEDIIVFNDECEYSIAVRQYIEQYAIMRGTLDKRSNDMSPYRLWIMKKYEKSQNPILKYLARRFFKKQ